MTKEVILENEFKKINAEGILGEDGKIYKAILNAMEIYKNDKQEVDRNGYNDIAFDFINSFIIPNFTEDEKNLHGIISQKIFEFVKLNEDKGVRYSDLNKYYQISLGGVKNYNPEAHRGGSFIHHLHSLKVPTVRRCRIVPKGKYQWIEKDVNGNYYYNES